MTRIPIHVRPSVLVPALLFPATVLGFPALMSHAHFDEAPASILAWVIYIGLFGASVHYGCRCMFEIKPSDPDSDQEIQQLLSVRRHRVGLSILAASLGLAVCMLVPLLGSGILLAPETLSTSYIAMLLLSWLAIGLAASDHAVHRALARRDKAAAEAREA
ncbi:hypothetical protein OEW28_08205 [Defluviimonas sp. WL0002]|uniref:Uncharacterized protein n=1 Tax=Albidovulum marisflavi TaxID=2984159 RepID=A0ABT2ZBW6_9RHOB|nr:hypothetical protein [Defluviimonas sp. WL0002]MCV2868609.1 hypothetical protein [Defluviimonas sp. WL0002]